MKVEHQLVLNQVMQLRRISPRMGTRKLYEQLNDFLLEHQIKMGRDALFDLLADNYMLVRRKRRIKQTTQSGHWLRRYPNMIKDIQVTRVNQVWVSDITYLKIHGGFLYISLITDVCSHKILGYDLADNLESVNALKALRMAITNAQQNKAELYELIHHSDQGFQYCSPLYTDMLNKHNIAISMSDKGQPLQNSIAERVNGILKHEYLLLHNFKDKTHVQQVLDTTITTYNKHRPHMSCNMLTPEKAHELGKPLKKMWKNYYKRKKQNV
jgi:transposase InsO family protein